MKFSTSKLVQATVIGLVATGANAFWRMPCRSRTGLARLDPLVAPGHPSDHAHAIHGSGAFTWTSTSSELQTSDCTSCEVTQDKSAYWTPPPYFLHANGSYELVPQVGGMLAYYLLYPNTGEQNVTAFPEGFQMIAGDTFQRNFTLPVPDPPQSEWASDPAQSSQSALRQKALGFNCLNYALPAEGSLYRHFLPDKEYIDQHCADGIRFELMFPSCWNGQPDSPDHKSHVAYPSLVMTGDCPPDYPIRLPSLFYETIWEMNAFAGLDGEFVISNGDPTGYGYHGDFIMGWDEGFLQQACDECTNLSGQIQDCPLFNIQSDPEAAQCQLTLPAALASEDVYGPVSTMPGNPAIQSGPAYATGGAHASPGATVPVTAAGVVPTLSHSAGQIIASTATYLPGAVFNAISTGAVAVGYAAAPSAAPSASPNYAVNVEVAVSVVTSVGTSAAASSPATTPAPTELSYGSTGQPTTYTTVYSTAADGVLELVMIEEYVTITPPTVTVTEFPAAAARRSRRRRHLHNHADSHNHNH